MCGILAVLNSTDDSAAMRAKILALSRRQRHRGPDWVSCVLKSTRFAVRMKQSARLPRCLGEGWPEENNE